MAKYQITGPDGSTYEVTAPDDATEDQVMTYARQQFAQTPAQKFARNLEAARAQNNPTAGMSGFEKFRAGYGKAAVDLVRGENQIPGWLAAPVMPSIVAGRLLRGNSLRDVFGTPTTKEQVAESRRLDAPLMATGPGMAGNITGSIVNTLPTGASGGTIAGAAATGAALGALQPSTSLGERGLNTAVGAVIAPAAALAGRGAAALYRGGKAMIEPFTKGGQERIAARALQAFAGGSEAAGQAAQNIEQGLAESMLPGVQPTTAELAKNAGLAQLERTVRNNPEALTALSERLQVNKEALISALDEIAGTPQLREAATTLRSAATQPLYSAADDMVVKADRSLTNLLSRPSMQKAWARAADLAAEAGQTIDAEGGQLSGKTLHYLKMAMDDLADNPQVSGIGGNEARAIAATRNSLVDWMDTNLPTYGMGRRLYATLSKPVNQMDIGTELRNKLQPALADFGATTRSRGEMYARALREGDDFAARTLGRSSARLGDIMTPQQMGNLTKIGEQLARRVNADELGRAVGSNTAQNLVGQNVLRQILGPLGLPESTIQRAAESTLLQSVMRPAQFVGKLGEERVLQTLARAALDPEVAKEMLRVGIDPMKIGLLPYYQGVVGPMAVGAAAPAVRNYLYSPNPEPPPSNALVH